MAQRPWLLTASTDDNDSLGHDDGMQIQNKGQKQKMSESLESKRKSLGDRLLLCTQATCASEVEKTLTRMPGPSRRRRAGPIRRRVFVGPKREPQAAQRSAASSISQPLSDDLCL